MLRRNAISFVASAVIAAGALPCAPAQAADHSDQLPSDTSPDRVIYVDGRAPAFHADGATKAAAEFAVIPKPGETVRVVYSDAVTDITTHAVTDKSTAAACTESVTVYTPYKPSSTTARVNTAFTISTGCASGKTGYAILYAVTAAANRSSFISNTGYTTSFSTTYTCNNTRSRSWHGFGRLGAAGGTTGPSATLSCDQP